MQPKAAKHPPRGIAIDWRNREHSKGLHWFALNPIDWPQPIRAKCCLRVLKNGCQQQCDQAQISNPVTPSSLGETDCTAWRHKMSNLSLNWNNKAADSGEPGLHESVSRPPSLIMSLRNRVFRQTYVYGSYAGIREIIQKCQASLL